MPLNSTSGDILVLVEHYDNQVDTLSLQLLKKSRQIANRKGVSLIALVLGCGVKSIAETVAAAGPDKVMTADYVELNPYNPEIYTRVLGEMINAANPSLILLGYSFLGMEIAPAISARLVIPLFSNCTDFDLSEDGSVTVTRPVYSGTLQVKIQSALPLIISVQKGALVGGIGISKAVEIVPFSTRIETNSLRTLVKEVIKPAIGEVDIAKAAVIVAAGRGVGQPANLNLIKKLAGALGGVIAATRPVIDMGWLPPEYLVGLSGKTVSPKIYLACGISGAAQHLAGMSDSQMIIAINKDASAPIFGVAHYAVVGDLFALVPAIINEIAIKK